MTHRAEIYRPHPDNRDALTRTWWWEGDLETIRVTFAVALDGARPSTMALILAICPTGETLVERWRVDSKGRVMRQRVTGEREEEVRGG